MDSDQRFEILRKLALAGPQGGNLEELGQAALAQVAEYVGLAASALLLWDEEFRPTLTVTFATDPAHKERLLSLEKELFEQLRRTRQLMSAYLSFSGTPVVHTFTMPLQYHGRCFGAVIGMQEGERTIIAEDVFLESLSAVFALHLAAESGGDSQALKETLDKERLSGIVETAVTVNHEVNNPLTAILGNVQLLLLKRDDLDDDLKSKLKTIEDAAMKIKDVTQRLMRISSPKSVDYADGTRMVDISEEESDEDK